MTSAYGAFSSDVGRVVNPPNVFCLKISSSPATQRSPTSSTINRQLLGCEDLAQPTALTVWIAGAKRNVTAAIKRKLKRRNAIEPLIGHLKSDGRLARNFLKGTLGEAINALLCGAGHNLRKILNQLRHFCVQRNLDFTALLDTLLMHPTL